MPDEPKEQGTVRYVRCPACGTPNPGTSTHCSRCAKPLPQTPVLAAPAQAAPQPSGPLTCPKCHKALPPGSRFCGFCGAPLIAPGPIPIPKAPERPAPPPRATGPIVVPKTTPPVPVRPVMPATEPTKGIAERLPSPPARPPAPKPAAPPAASPPAAPGTQVFAGLHVPKVEATVTEVKPDGSTGKSLRIIKETYIGQGNCDLSYPEDALLAPRHASIFVREGKLTLKDHASQNGTFIKQRQDTELSPGDVFLVGRTLFRFVTQNLDEAQNAGGAQSTAVFSGPPKLQRGPVTAKLEHILLSGEVVKEHSLEKTETTIGRATGDLVFKEDPYMSGTHARIVAQPGRFILQDMKSRNGVYRRIRNDAELKDGDEFFLGEELFRVGLKIS